MTNGTHGGQDALGDRFYPLFRRLFNEDGDFVGEMDGKLAAARMPQNAEMYISRGLAVGVLAGGVLWVLGTLLGWMLFATGIIEVDTIIGMPVPSAVVLEFINIARIPALILITGLFFGTIGFIAGFGSLLAIPYMRASERKREINMLLPDAVAFMYALSVGGLNQIEILETMAKADDTYGEVAQEFQTIVQETSYFDTDYRTAIRNQAFDTPSDDLSQFLTDMLSILNSGGDLTRFLEDKKDKHMRTAKQEQEVTLDTLELFGEMYMTLSLFPLLLIIILVIMSMLGEASEFMLYITVYALIPLIGLGFLVMISTVKQDEPGDGFLSSPNVTPRADGGTALESAQRFSQEVNEASIFTKIKRRELLHQAITIAKAPHVYFRNNPVRSLYLTLPIAIVVLLGAISIGVAPRSLGGFRSNPVWGTFVWVYLPLYIVCIPLAIFYEWNVRSRYAIIGNLSDNLRKLSSANDTGQTLLESIDTVARTSQGKLADEFATIRAKVDYGTSLGDALVEFNNTYHIPRLARTVKLIQKAQEASSQITDVLTTAAQASENQDDIDRERRARTMMQVVIIIMTYLTLLAVMAILQVQFLEVLGGMAGGAEEGGNGGMEFGGGVEVSLLSLMFFHAVTMQAILSGLICGYMRDANVISGVKYMIILVSIALGVWVMVD